MKRTRAVRSSDVGTASGSARINVAVSPAGRFRRDVFHRRTEYPDAASREYAAFAPFDPTEYVVGFSLVSSTRRDRPMPSAIRTIDTPPAMHNNRRSPRVNV